MIMKKTLVADGVEKGEGVCSIFGRKNLPWQDAVKRKWF
jgi:hypothetical protein